MRKRKCRKGQFFITAAIAIIVILYGLSDFVKIQSFDATGIQTNMLPFIAMEIEKDINDTFVSSAKQHAAENLEELIIIEKERLAGLGYSLEVTYNISGTPKTALIRITSPGAYYEKTTRLG